MIKITLLAGDGIGPEIMREAQKVLAHLDVEVQTNEVLVGGASIDAHGIPLTDEALEVCRKSDALLFACIGGEKWADVEFDKRPEAGLLRLRKDLDLFANLRPAIVFDALIDASTLKPEIVRGLDILIVRELTGGVYFGEPRGIEDIGGGKRKGVNTQVYDSDEITRLGEVAFELARTRSGKVTSCEKSNVMESGLLWRQEITKLHEEKYADVKLEHMLADNCAMQLLRNPSQFDVIATDNLFGDMLSDEAAMLTGSLGMLPSASLGAAGSVGLYEPVHGSAPDIAGKNVANPLAMILSLAMAFRYSLNRGDLADKIEGAVQKTLLDGIRTADIAQTGQKGASTQEIGDAVVERL